MKKSNDGDDHGVVVSFILVVCSVFIFGRQLYCMFSFMYYLQHERPCCISEIQTRTEGESLYIRYNTDANVVNGLLNVLMRTFVFFNNLK